MASELNPSFDFNVSPDQAEVQATKTVITLGNLTLTILDSGLSKVHTDPGPLELVYENATLQSNNSSYKPTTGRAIVCKTDGRTTIGFTPDYFLSHDEPSAQS